MADAIRQQNWFTVVIEVFIVVVGIFIGLQVDDWSQSRKAETASCFWSRWMKTLNECFLRLTLQSLTIKSGLLGLFAL
jgi:hypothetical protein